MDDFGDGFEDFIDELTNKEQPESCNIDNPEDCEACGS
tara:strand:+ start:955 stop:1068 length:114 start_codon:yes stop_codon:yes gene_type:complete